MLKTSKEYAIRGFRHSCNYNYPGIVYNTLILHLCIRHLSNLR